MIIGTGIDIVDLDVFRGRLSDELIAEVFLPAEAEYAATQVRSWENLGGRLAAKEAAFKALGAGLSQGLRWRDVEVCREESGAISLKLHGKAAELATSKGVTRCHVSLSHSSTAAMAAVVMENDAES